MLEKIIMDVCQQMSDVLDKEQIQQLKNVMFINFHDKKIIEEKCEIIPAESDEDVRLIKLFRASKLVAGRADSTMEQYIAELRYCRNTIGKKLPRDHNTGFEMVFWYDAGTAGQ